jgi:C-terminal processing protease CtpA/Prc
VLTGATTFSGGEQLSYDLQQLGRATIIGERTRGGANAREGFRVHPHLEATISVAEAVHPKTGTNWEGTGVTPDIQATAAQAGTSPAISPSRT